MEEYGLETFQMLNREDLKYAPHFLDAMKQGQKMANTGKPMVLLKGNNQQEMQRIAAALVFGYHNPDYPLPEYCLFDSKKQQEEITEEKSIKKQEMRKLELELDRLMSRVERLQSDEDTDMEDETDCNIIKMNVVKVEMEETKEGLNLKFNGERISAPISVSFYFYGNLNYNMETKVLNQIKEIQENQNNELLILAFSGMSEYRYRKLEFENNAIKYEVSSVPFNYYEHMFVKKCKELGVELESEKVLEDSILLLKNYRGADFSEEDFETAIIRAKERAKKRESHSSNQLQTVDFDFFESGYQDPEKQLFHLIGQQEVKKKIITLVRLHQFEMKRQVSFYEKQPKNIALKGHSGTGKTSFARLYAEILAKYGVTNGKFVVANKSDYVGKYVGHTADKVCKLFEENRGGVIFIDEAAALLTRDDFAVEALTEFVRFMEMYPDVICIFASYPEKIEELLNKDEGMRSRIAQVISFENYTKEELFEIFQWMAGKEQYEIADSVKNVFFEYVESRMNKKGWGNAREVRNLFLKSKEVMATKTMETGQDPKCIHSINQEDIVNAIEQFKKQEKYYKTKPSKVGFAI